MRLYRFSICLTLSLSLAAPASAAPTAAQVCQKMIADGRGGGLSQAACLCNYQKAEAALDDDIKALLFDTWYNGTNNMKALEKLPKQGRVKRQMRLLHERIQRGCPPF